MSWPRNTLDWAGRVDASDDAAPDGVEDRGRYRQGLDETYEISFKGPCSRGISVWGGGQGMQMERGRPDGIHPSS